MAADAEGHIAGCNRTPHPSRSSQLVKRYPGTATAHSGRNSCLFLPPGVRLRTCRAKTALETPSEPRAEQGEALRERAVTTLIQARFIARPVRPQPGD